MKETILVIHGLGGSHKSRLCRTIRERFEKDYEVYTPDIPVSPKEAFKFLKGLVSDIKPSLIVGTSLGGFYAMALNEPVKTLLINPAMSAYEDISKSIGKGVFPFRNERLNNEKEYVIDDTFLNELKDIKEAFDKEEKKAMVTGLFGSRDELFRHIDDFKRIYGEKNASLMDEGHHVSDEGLTKIVMPKINLLLNIK